MGFIYKIECNVTGEVYYGQSADTEYNRFTHHKSKGNKCSSKTIIDRGNYTWTVLENDVDVLQLRTREHFYITNNECINKYIPFIEGSGKKERTKIACNRLYAENEEFRTRLKQYSKDYYVANKEEIEKKRKAKIKCECGGRYTHINRLRHESSLIHKKYLISQDST